MKKATDVITLAACLLALLQYGDSVPAHLQADIQAAKSQLAHGDAQGIQELVNAIETDEQLRQLFQASFNYLMNQPGQQQERAKSAVSVLSPSSIASVARPKTLPASVSQWSNHASSHQLNPIDMATEILDAPDGNYWARARQFFNQPQNRKQLEKASEDIKAIASAASQLHPNKITLMQKLDISPFTVRDLAYLLNVPVERAQNYAKSLWNEGYIRPLSRNLLGQIWLSISGADPIDQVPTEDTYLKLTARGYFYLHPGAFGKRKAA